MEPEVIEARGRDDLGYDLRLTAVNHWPTAIKTHTVNHPDAKHICASVTRVDPYEAGPDGDLDVLLASPECIWYSRARGGRPVNDQARSSAWEVQRWIEAKKPNRVLIENVREFRDWGPLHPCTCAADSQDPEADHTTGCLLNKPIKERKGEIYREFIDAIRALGYAVEDRVLNAANYGGATTRERLFIQARRGVDSEITWPDPTHDATGTKGEKWVAARSIIDWSIPGKSIFGRKRPLAPATIKRILAGLAKYGGPALEPFLVILRNHADGKSIDSPVPALCAGGNHVGLAEPFVMHLNRPKDRERSVEEPMQTVTARSSDFGLVQPVLTTVNHGEGDMRSSSVDEPMKTVTSKGSWGLAEAFIVPFFGEAKGQAPRTHSVDKPLPAVTSHGAGALVEPIIVELRKGQDGRSIDKPLSTITTMGATHAVVTPFILPHRQFDRMDVDSVEKPLRTFTASGGDDFGLVLPVIVPIDNRSNEDGTKSIDDPLGTVTTKARFAVAEPFLVTAGGPIGKGRNPHSVNDPIGTILTENHTAVVEPFLTKYYGNESGAQSVADPLDTVTTKDRFALIMPEVDGARLDIRFRMLEPKELAAAMGLEGYQFAGNRAEQVKQIGNAVHADLAQAILTEMLTADVRTASQAAA